MKVQLLLILIMLCSISCKTKKHVVGGMGSTYVPSYTNTKEIRLETNQNVEIIADQETKESAEIYASKNSIDHTSNMPIRGVKSPRELSIRNDFYEKKTRQKEVKASIRPPKKAPEIEDVNFGISQSLLSFLFGMLGIFLVILALFFEFGIFTVLGAICFGLALRIGISALVYGERLKGFAIAGVIIGGAAALLSLYAFFRVIQFLIRV